MLAILMIASEGCRMKSAVLFSIPLPLSNGVCWRWRSSDGTTDSTKSFVSYYDCRFDAEANGYCAETPPRPPHKTAPRIRRIQR
jgi:hypothetical protein